MNFFDTRLAQRKQTFSVGAKIRVGTKAPTKATKESELAMGIYANVQAGKMSFREAEKLIADKAGIRNPFFPRNTREFHAHPWDMGTGGATTSERLLDLYGEMMEGDRQRKLYRFPIVFPEVGNDVSSIVEGGLSVQGGGANMIRYWSEFDASGLQVCKHLPEVKKSAMAQRQQGRPIRHPERKPVTRGPCVPESCNEYGMGMCRFNGTIRFYIPGLSGAGVFELHTGSTEAATDIYLRVTTALRAMGNTIRNYTPDGRPVFWLRKVRKSRGYFDEEGNRKIGEQWVPELDMEIEMPKVIMIAQAKSAGQLCGTDSDAQSAPPSAWLQDDSAGHADRAVDVVDAQSQEDGKEGGGREASQSFNASHGNAVVSTSTGEVQGSQQSQGVGSAVSVMRQHAEEHGYTNDLDTWVKTRNDGDEVKAAKSWQVIAERFGPRVKDWLALSLYIEQHEVSTDLVMGYLKGKFGPIGPGTHLKEMLGHLKGLFSDGVSVAVAVMEEAVIPAG